MIAFVSALPASEGFYENLVAGFLVLILEIFLVVVFLPRLVERRVQARWVPARQAMVNRLTEWANEFSDHVTKAILNASYQDKKQPAKKRVEKAVSDMVEGSRASYQALLGEIAIYTASMDADLMQRVSSIMQGASAISRSIVELPNDLRWANDVDVVDDYVESITDLMSDNYGKLLKAVCEINEKMGIKCFVGENGIVAVGDVNLPDARLMSDTLTSILKWAIDERAFQA